MKRKKHFLPKMDIALLTEVLKHNPFKNGSAAYARIARQLKKSRLFGDVGCRSMQQRVEKLLKNFRSQQLQSRGQSGTAKEYKKRERLLQELSDLQKEWTTQKREAAPTPSPNAVRQDSARLDTMVSRSIKDREATPLTPVMTSSIVDKPEAERAECPAVREEPEGAAPALGYPLPCQGEKSRGDAPPLRTPPLAQPEQNNNCQAAAQWTWTINYMWRKMETEEESKMAALAVQKEELGLKMEELEIRKMEAKNERLRIEAQEREQKRRADLEEERQKQDREERRLQQDRHTEERKNMLERQNMMGDAILRLLHQLSK